MDTNRLREPDGAQGQPPIADGSLLEFLTPLAGAWRRLLLLPLLVGSAAVGISYLVPKTYRASTTVVTQQTQSTGAASALASLGALGALSGFSLGARGNADMYVALMQSVSATDRIIDGFKLMEVYELSERWKARERLLDHTGISIGKKDGLITVTVEDRDPQRAAEIANRYVDELRRLTTELALTEAQGRRRFFEAQLERARRDLAAAQASLQASGFTLGALRAEPKAAAESYAKLRAELTAAEVKLQSLRSSFADSAPEVQRLQSTVSALRAQLARSETASAAQADSDYVGKYREFKYQEMLHEQLGRQYELARVDEQREGAVIQVIDPATAPERKASPTRSVYGILGSAISFLLLAAWVLVTARLRLAEHADPQGYARWQQFKRAFRSADAPRR
jgi:capsule polysaccharide export protein KpsE/RkpR